MRSVPAGSFARLSQPVALWRAYLAARKGKRRQPVMARFDLEADRHVLDLARQLEAGRYRTAPFRLKIIHEPKARLIAAAALVDRVVHHALLTEIGPTFERGFIDHSYACCAGRGAHRAVIRHLGWTRRHRYRLSLDVARYFPSVEHARLRALLARRIRDERTLALIDEIIAAGGAVYQSAKARKLLGEVSEGRGLAIGTWFSQWSGALYLNGLDHFIKRELKIGAYLRYGDDLALFADDRDALVAAREAIGAWLAAERGLALNAKRGQVDPTTRPCTFLGYRISRAGLRPARATLKR